MTTGERIQAARKEKGLSQQELGKRLGVSGSMIGQYENDLRNPKYDTLQKIADALGVQMGVLIGWDDADREYEQVRDTLESVGFKIEATGFNYGGGPGGDTYFIKHNYLEGGEDENPEEIEYQKLTDIVYKVLKDAETNKAAYIQRRLELEIFWPEGIRPKE